MYLVFEKQIDKKKPHIYLTIPFYRQNFHKCKLTEHIHLFLDILMNTYSTLILLNNNNPKSGQTGACDKVKILIQNNSLD